MEIKCEATLAGIKRISYEVIILAKGPQTAVEKMNGKTQARRITKFYCF